MYWLNQTVDTLCKFRLDTVPEFWVVDIWDKLLDVDNLPQEFEEAHLDTPWPELLAETVSCAQKCAPSRDSSTGGPSTSSSTSEVDSANITLWTVALKRGICPKTLIAVLGFFVEKGMKCSGNLGAMSLGLQASHLYITLLSLPGNGAHQLFNNVIYQRAIESLQVVKVIARKDRESGTTSPKGPRCRKRGAANQRLLRLSQQSDVQAEDDPEEDGQTWTEACVSRLTEKLSSFVCGIVRLLETHSFRSYKNLLDETVEKLCMLVVESDGSGRKALANTSVTAFDALAASCNALHGDVSLCVEFVMKHLLEVIIMGASTSKALQLILHMMAEVGDDAVEGVKGLVQNICIRVPEKADARARVATYVVCLLTHLPSATHAALVKWLRDRYMWSIKVAYRIFVVELFARLLGQRQREPPADGSVTENSQRFLRHDTLLATVIQRCSDKAATVRSKALTVFGDCLGSTDPHVAEAVSRILSLQSRSPVVPETAPNADTPTGALPPEMMATSLSLRKMTPAQDEEGQQRSPVPDSVRQISVSSLPSVSANESETGFNNADTFAPLMASETLANAEETELPDHGKMMEMLKKRAAEEKVNVRKVALQVIEGVLKIQAALLTTETLQLLQNHCRDPSVMVRKQMAVSLTSLMQRYPQAEHVQRAWMHGVFPLIVDCESTVQEKCLELLDALLVQNIARHRDAMPTAQSMAWRVFHALAHEENQMFRYFQKALTAWYRQGKLKANLVGDLATHVGTANDGAAWLLLSFVTLMVNVKDASYAVEYWKAHFKDERLNFTVLRQALTVLANSAKSILLVDRNNLLADMKNSILNFDCAFELVSPTVSAVAKFYDSKPRASTNDNAQTWGSAVMQACNENLSRMILNERYRLTDGDEDTVLRQLHTTSDICFKCRLQPPKRLILAIESLITTRKLTTDEVARANSQKPLNDSAARPRIRAQAFVTLGKLSLLDEVLAKQYVPAFANELESSDDPVIRNNIVIIFTDLCRRYATLVDPHLSAITACLRDPSTTVQMQTLTALAKLLREEYIKWKGPLYFRMLVALVDKDAEIRNLANYCLSQVLMLQHPQMLSQHFVECVFHFNCYQDHPTYNKFSQTDKEIKLFSLKGGANASKRITLYRYMLQNMDDSHRLQITARLCQDVLGPIVDEVLPLDRESYSVLQDSLRILSCEDIKLVSMTAPSQDAVEGGDDEDVVAAAVANVKRNLITQVVKFNVIEHIMPTVISLKQMLEKHRSPLLRDLMAFLKEIMKDFRNEVKEVLAVDQQLAKEIEFDLKRYEQETEQAATVNRENEDVQNLLDSFCVEPSRHDGEQAAQEPASRNEADETESDLVTGQEGVRNLERARKGTGKKRAKRRTVIPQIDQSRTPVVLLERLVPQTCPQLARILVTAQERTGTPVASTSGLSTRRSSRIRKTPLHMDL